MAKPSRNRVRGLPKTPTGVPGLDEVTLGGLPAGRPTLVCGDAGCGKTLFALHFLMHGIRDYGESGVFMSFEERPEDLAANVTNFGFDLPALIRKRKLVIDYVRIDRSEIQETGSYSLDGLFIRLASAIDAVGAKRVVLDTVEALFGGLSDMGILRAELRRLFMWLKDRGVTSVITGESGNGALTRHGLEEFVSDCVIFLDHRVSQQMTTRRLRIVKYRGSAHGTNEYPFLIDDEGMTVLPITSSGLQHTVSSERISTGIPRLDSMLGGRGLYRGSSVLISGHAGTGKSSLAAHLVEAACLRGERATYFAFEESPSQIVRNMRSIGIDLQTWIDKGLLEIQSSRPTARGLEQHLLLIDRALGAFKPRLAVLDPVSALINIGSSDEVREMLMRLVDTLKTARITAVFTSLAGLEATDTTEVGMSSLMDTWLLLRAVESNGERNRTLYILKSRGMAHSNQEREFILTNEGVQLRDVYVGPGGVLTGTARTAQESRDRAEVEVRKTALSRRKRSIDLHRHKLQAEIADLQRQLESDNGDLQALVRDDASREARENKERHVMATHRQADHLAIRSHSRARSKR